MTESDHRGGGRTSRQMMAATYGAIFVWCNEHTQYAKALAKSLGRDDIRIVSPGWLESIIWRGHIVEIVVDHAAQLTPLQSDHFERAQSRYRAVLAHDPQPKGEWRPIDDAARAAGFVYVHRLGDRGWDKPVCAHWIEDRAGLSGWFAAADDGYLNPVPTHWQPLKAN